MYFQPGSNEPERWEALFKDSEATIERFRSHLLPVLPALPDKEDELGKVEHEGFSVIENPVLEYSLSNLTFDQRGIGSSNLGKFDMVRCFNVLCYFDRSFRKDTIEWMPGVLSEGGIFLTGMNWTRSRHARYAVYQNENGQMVPKEFAFSVENIRPLELVAWFALHDDDFSTAVLAELVRTIRADEDLCSSIDNRMDELLIRAGFKPRSENGYLGGLSETADPSTLDSAADLVGKALEREGYAQKAVDVLNNAGYNAWINCVGHIAIDPNDLNI